MAWIVLHELCSNLQLVAHVILYAVHLFAHALSVFVDPADPNLRRKDSKRPVPKFNRSEHAHVIENGHCHLCDIDISSQASKNINTVSICYSDIGRTNEQPISYNDTFLNMLIDLS